MGQIQTSRNLLKDYNANDERKKQVVDIDSKPINDNTCLVVKLEKKNVILETWGGPHDPTPTPPHCKSFSSPINSSSYFVFRE